MVNSAVDRIPRCDCRASPHSFTSTRTHVFFCCFFNIPLSFGHYHQSAGSSSSRQKCSPLTGIHVNTKCGQHHEYCDKNSSGSLNSFAPPPSPHPVIHGTDISSSNPLHCIFHAFQLICIHVKHSDGTCVPGLVLHVPAHLNFSLPDKRGDLEPLLPHHRP